MVPMRLEWLILADFAQIVANKLYVQGGGWDVLTVNSGFPVQQNIGLAVAFSVPWDATNQRHNVEIEVQTDDGEPIAKIGGQVEVGRPPGIPPGQAQRFQMAANIGLTLAKPGIYVIVAKIEGEEAGRVHFNVVPGPLLAAKQQRPGPS